MINQSTFKNSKVFGAAILLGVSGVVQAQTVYELGPRDTLVNPMKGVNPKIPVFPKLTIKKGFIRGYVKDSVGKPLQGAVIGVRSTAVGGYYSGAQGKSDAKGYYEIAVPFGAASFYCAGYAIDYGEGRAALGLHPADGEAGGFASNAGGVENWVMLPYGVADRDAVQDQPHYSGNYYGGAFALDYYPAEENSVWNQPYYIPKGAIVEVTLTPVGNLINGYPGRSFTVRKTSAPDADNRFNVVNIPIGTYTVQANMIENGKKTPLLITETGPNSSRPFGLESKEVLGKTKLTFRPSTAKPAMANAGHSNWDSLAITLKKK
jgi:hypothetical protein